MAAAQLVLPARLEGPAVPALRTELLAQAANDLVLAGAGVQRINGLGLQLLVSTDRTWRAAGRSVSIAAPSEALAAALGRLPTPLETTEE